MNRDENKQDEALKADESEIEVESPATEESEEVSTDEVETTDELPAEDEGEEVEAESTDEEEAEAAPEDKGRKTAESRIRQLNAEKKAAEEQAKKEREQAESLAEQVKKLTNNRPEPTDIPAADTDESELTYEELMRRNAALIDIKLAQQRNIDRVNQEAVEAIGAHPELNPDSEQFDADLSKSISEAVLAKVQSDPTASVKGFVDNLMKPYKRSVEKQASDQKETITKQVSEQAMRPTQVQKQEKPFSELSIEEMEKKLGVEYR